MPSFRLTTLARLAVPLLALGSGCFSAGYLAQAADGEMAMLMSARPLLVCLQDPQTPAHTKRLLFRIAQIKAFGQARGLSPTRNYQRYADLQRDAAVWVVEACPPLSFQAHRWSFPVVGSVPYLGFFDPAAARRYGDALAHDGFDVEVRGASAFSTLGWFRDPVLSTMLSEDDAAEGDLADTVLHESLHATIYLPNQSTFDESLASYVGDHLARDWLLATHGEQSPATRDFEQHELRSRKRIARLHMAHDDLTALYASALPDAVKLTRKQVLLHSVQQELGLRHPLNNASLAGYQTYDTGGAALDNLFHRCGDSWPRFIAAVATVKPSDFDRPQQEDLSAVIELTASRGCPEAQTR